MRGAVYMRMGKCRKTGQEVWHLLHAVSRSRKLTCRSSFGSELLAARGAANGLQQHLLALREMERGPASTDEIPRLREEGGDAIPAELVVDGMPSLVAERSATRQADRGRAVVRCQGHDGPSDDRG